MYNTDSTIMHVLAMHAVDALGMLGGVCPIAQYEIPLIFRSIHKGYGLGVCVAQLLSVQSCSMKGMVIEIHINVNGCARTFYGTCISSDTWVGEP